MWADAAEVPGDGVTESTSHLGKVLSCLGCVQQWTSAVSDRCWPTPVDGRYASCCLNSLVATLLGTYIGFDYLFIPKTSSISWFLLPTHLPKSQNATLNQFLFISFIPFLLSATSTLQCFSCGSVFSIFLMLGWLLISVSPPFVVWSSCKFVVLRKGWVSMCLAEQRLLWMKLNKAVTAGERSQD